MRLTGIITTLSPTSTSTLIKGSASKIKNQGRAEKRPVWVAGLIVGVLSKPLL